MHQVAIIGSAGRGSDAQRLTSDSFPRMVAEAERVALKLAGGRPWCAVSGGAAWSDHIAVELFLRGVASNLFIAFPAEFTSSGFLDNGVRGNAGGVANFYHRQFSQKLGHNTFSDISRVLGMPGCSFVVGKGLFDRNSIVAKADDCLALTFGSGARLKKGGTSDTMAKFMARGAGRSVHIDLNDFRAFSPAKLPLNSRPAH